MNHLLFFAINAGLALFIGFFIYFVLVPVFRKDVGLGVLISLFLLIPMTVSYALHVDGTKEVKRNLIPKEKYQVARTSESVVFVIEGQEPIKTNRAFVYNHAKDTSKVKLYRIKEINWFNSVRNENIRIETVKSDS